MHSDIDDYDGLMRWSAIEDWMDGVPGIPGAGPITSVEPLLGGSQNLLFLIGRGSARMVLRRPPRHPRKNSNDTMLREARVLTALSGSKVPHAKLYAVCEDTGLTGACFYLMAPLEGFAPKGPLPGAYAYLDDWRREMGLELVRAAAALAQVDYQAVGLSDFGKAVDWHGRQVTRWRSQLDGYREQPGYTVKDIGVVDAIGQWLDAHIPADRRIGVIHGDYQWPNVMFSLNAPRIVGLIDWELSTLGDPMLDLGWMLTSWIESGDPEGRDPMIAPWSGFVSRRQLVEYYCMLTGRDPADAAWFFTLACYKLACILEGSYARSLAGQAPADVGERLHRIAAWLFAKAAQLIEQKPLTALFLRSTCGRLSNGGDA